MTASRSLNCSFVEGAACRFPGPSIRVEVRRRREQDALDESQVLRVGTEWPRAIGIGV